MIEETTTACAAAGPADCQAADRAAALARYAILDTPTEPLFDGIAELAADICETPIAVVNFVGSDRQWFKAEVGIGARELPLDVSICQHALLQPGVFVVPDLSRDERFRNNPLVGIDGGLRFYAGVLLETPEGLPIGTVCVLDHKPRQSGITRRQTRVLEALARQVMSELELRLALRERNHDVQRAREDEERIRASEAAMATVLANMSDGFCAIDREWRVTHFNEAAERYYGLSRDEIIGRDFWELFPAGRGTTFEAKYRHALETDTAVSFETGSSTRPGRIVSVRATPTPAGLAIVFSDITEQRQAEEAQRASQARLRDMADAMPVLISYVDREHRFRFVNKPYEDWFERPLDQINNRPLHELMGDEVYAARRPYIERALAGERVTYEVTFPHPKGTRQTIVQHIPHFGGDGQVLGIYALVQDVTEQKQAEAALRDSRDRLQAVLDATPAAILIATDTSCTEILGNQRATELMRMAPEGNLSRSNPDTPAHHFKVYSTDGRELAPHELPVQRAVRGDELWSHEEKVVFSDGESVHLLGNAVPLRSADGTIRGAVGAFIDITERKRAEEHQRLLIDELNHRVKNTLAIVQGVAHQSFRGDAAMAEARQAFEGRLAALSAAHSLLTQQSWEAAPLRQVIADALEAVAPRSGGVTIDGPDVLLSPKTAVSIAMAIHELGTNARKYGALSVRDGSIIVDWRIEGGRLNLCWREKGGPAVEPPKTRGFGTRMIERGLAAELGGTAKIDFHPDGIVCTVDAPAPGLRSG